MRPHRVLRLLGYILRPLAAILLLPAAVDVAYGNPRAALGFSAVALVAFLLGALLVRFRGEVRHVGRVEALAVVAAAWLAAAGIGGVPYLLQGFAPVDALFESMSGFTTTGSTVFAAGDFARVSRGLLFWRALTQWVGGLGIIVLFVAVLPALAVAGRHLFFAEAPGPDDEALTPRIRHTAVALWKLYVGLTVAEAALLRYAGGMDLFDAVCHAFTTLAAGGFSPHPSSLEGYPAAAQWIVLPFMFLAGTSFSLQYRALRRPSLLVADVEFRAYAAVTLLGGLLLALLIAGSPGHGFLASLRHGLFQASSILTTTGYASEDFDLWQPAPLMVLCTLMFVGGCAGSAAGGPKVVRLIVLAKVLARELVTALHPRVVRMVRLGGRAIPPETLRQIVGFLVAYFTVFGVVTVLAGILENDFRVGITGAIATLGNIGPGLGRLGPMESFATLGAPTKVLFTLAMWIGRLEVMTVFVLFQADALRTLFSPPRPRP